MIFYLVRRAFEVQSMDVIFWKFVAYGIHISW